MRLGRIILLASLAQLLGLPALVAALSQPIAARDVHPDAALAHADAAWALFEPVFTEATGPIPAPAHASSLAMLALSALSETPLRHSLWMVAPAVRTVAVPRPRTYTLLRC